MSTTVNVLNTAKHAVGLVLPTPKPSPDDIQTAAPLRKIARQNIVNQYNTLQNELPIYYKAGITYWQIRPLNDFLNLEMVWWNNNVELGVQQVITRETYDKEQIELFKKDFEKQFTQALSALPVTESKDILLELANASKTPSTSTDTAKINDALKTTDASKTASTDASKTASTDASKTAGTGTSSSKDTSTTSDTTAGSKVASAIIDYSKSTITSAVDAIIPSSFRGSTQGFIDINISDSSGSKLNLDKSVNSLTDVIGLTAPGPGTKAPIPDIVATESSTTLNLGEVGKNLVNTLTPAQIAQNELLQQKITRDWKTDIQAALNTAKNFLYTLIYIALALRLAGFVANDLLYKPLLYRLLAFLYAFTLLPILLPYYIYREIKYWFFPNDVENSPKFESIFPMKPYDPALPLSFDKRLYGYANTPGINAWMSLMRERETQARLSVLKGGTVYQKLTEQKVKAK